MATKDPPSTVSSLISCARYDGLRSRMINLGGLVCASAFL